MFSVKFLLSCLGSIFSICHKKVGRVRSLTKNFCHQVGRNSPCICGKTKPDGKPVKFKKCCLSIYEGK
jgi:hypothetical protein